MCIRDRLHSPFGKKMLMSFTRCFGGYLVEFSGLNSISSISKLFKDDHFIWPNVDILLIYMDSSSGFWEDVKEDNKMRCSSKVVSKSGKNWHVKDGHLVEFVLRYS